jgi:glyoxylase-like metal-dependent hydrolase (beta-lactamase superfamily II)
MAEYEIYALKCAGPLTSSGAFAMWLKEWETTVERNYYIWCIKGHNDVVVVDACITPALAKERNIPGYVSPVEALSRIGIKADEVRHVAITHAHWDHVNGLMLFPSAKVYIQEEEYNFWLKNQVAERPPFRQFIDVESKKYLVALEGHSIGLQAVAVKTKKGTAVLGSDCGHLFRNYREDWPSSLFVDLVALMNTYRKLSEKASSEDLIFPGHDPAMTTGYERVAEGITRLV